MRCSSCGARCDPTRSFCPACGSAVFLDDAAFAASQRTLARVHPTVQAEGQASQQTVSLSTSQQTAQQTASPRRSPQRTRTRQVSAPPVGTAAVAAVGSLIRWVVFIGIAVYAYNALQGIPEIRQITTDLLRGNADLSSVRDALGSILNESSGGDTGDAQSRTGKVEGSAPVEATPPSTRQIFEPGEAGVTAPLAIQRVPAKYAEEALKRGLQGTVILRVVVEPDGSVSDVAVTRSVDSIYGLDEEATKAVRQWRFEPGKRNGEPVRSTAIVTVTFARRSTPAAEGRR